MSNTIINIPADETSETIPDPNNPNLGNYTYFLSLLGNNFTTGNYNIKMTATNAAGTSAQSNTLPFTITPPDTPTNLIGIPTDTTISLSWNVANSGSGSITSFDISYNPVGSTQSPIVINNPSSPYNYTLTGLTATTTYNISVKASNSFGSSGYCTAIQVTTTTPQRVPSVPSNISGQPSVNSISLTWQISDPGVPSTITRVDISYNPVGSIQSPIVINNPSFPYNYTLTGLNTTTSYNIQINATNAAGTSAYSSPVTTVTTLSQSQNWYGYPDATNPTYIYTNVSTIFFPSILLNPSISQVTPDANDNWVTRTTGNLYTTYPVSAPLAKDSFSNLPITGSGVLGSFWQVINGILTTQYPIYFKSSQIIAPNTLPSTPVLAAGSDITTSSVLLTWTVASDGSSPITSFNISYSNNPLLNILVGATGKPSAGTFTYTLTGLNPNTMYDISLNAVNSVGASPSYSNTITITTPQISGQGSWYLINQTTSPVDANLPNLFIFSNAPKILFASFILDPTITSATGSDGWITQQSGNLYTSNTISMPGSYSSSEGFSTSGLTPGLYWQVVDNVLTTQYPVVFKIGQRST